MTNRQWMESLSDEEFRDFLIHENCENACSKNSAELCDGDCEKNVLSWIQAEHKE